MVAWGQTVTYVTAEINPLIWAVVGGDGGGGCCCVTVVVLCLLLVFFLLPGRP